MSKKTHQRAAEKEAAKANKSSTGSTKRPAARKQTRPPASKSVKSGAYPPPEQVRSLRLIALLVALLALVGAIFLAVSSRDFFSTWAIIGLIVLIALAGIALLTAARAADVLRLGRRSLRR